ncbi:MAG: penicillin acylase family protein [Acidobacteria bacterium]|nr:penicillin acylase family protein [Acidobacteriota bacterium]
MNRSVDDRLRRLGAGESIQSLCTAFGMSRQQFEDWWRAEIRSRVPETEGRYALSVNRPVRIERDSWGIPRISADNDLDLFFAYGFAMAQDRLFQLDYLRRKGQGRLAEILGADGIESDVLVRTVGLPGIAAEEESRLPDEVAQRLQAFSDGINAWMERSRTSPPIEFDLLDYEPEPWSPAGSLAIQVEFQWYLTGRFPVIVIPELAKRRLPSAALYRAFLQGESDEESILHAGDYSARPGQSAPDPAAGPSGGDPCEGEGSNNWAIAGSRTRSGRPLLASDPHIAFAAVSCWYGVHLRSPSLNVAGTGYAGVPAVMIGRNQRVAWGVTNNICSQRDLYQEKTDPGHPGCFLHDGDWEPARDRTEEIKVKGAPALTLTVQHSRNGPIVDSVLPPLARDTGPVSLRWLGAEGSGWLAALQRMNGAGGADQFRQALKEWIMPTWNLVFADVEGNIGHQSTGRIPIRQLWERGYRPGWDPAHQWDGLIPFEGMPALKNPERGWIATANNRPAPDDYPYPLSGTWSSGHRARRVRQRIEDRRDLSREDLVGIQHDVLSLRARECLPHLLQILDEHSPENEEAVEELRGWDGRMETDSAGASIFETFFTHWSRTVAGERFPEDQVELVSGAIGGLASQLLKEDPAGWFERQPRRSAVVRAWRASLAELSRRMGPEVSSWTWGRAHRIHLRHVLSGRGDLGVLLDRGGQPVKGNGITVCNTGYDPNWGATMGANFRMIADLGSPDAGLWTVDAQGQSGNPGSPHYGDQLPEWLGARYHYLALDLRSPDIKTRTTLNPAGE